MTIFVEYAILDNLVINAILLWFTFRTVKHKLVWWKIAICIFIGTLFAVVVPLATMGLLTVFSPRNFYIAIIILMAVKLLTTVMFLFVLSQMIKFLNLKTKATNHIRDVVITYKGKTIKTRGFLDTGNRLTDPTDSSPIVVISLNLYLKMFPIIKGHYIDVATVTSTAKMLVFSPTNFTIDKTPYENVKLGVSMRNFRDSVKYDVLLNPLL